ncbi:MAG: radical SAM protein, partial [bacterium]|nr:radical SAM protein [bacterium]
LYRLAGVGGVYVPSLYEVGYDDAGRVTDVVARGGAPERIRRRWTADLDAYSGCSTVISPEAEFSDTWLIEISRGCGRRCRFCMAGHCYLPPRRRSREAILAAAEQGLQLTDRIGLVGAAVSDYPGIDDLAWELTVMGARISVASLRVDTLGPGLLKALASSRSRTLTVAPEAGSERLRRVINKHITEEQVLNGVRMAAEAGFRGLKFYFIIGLPCEKEEDIRAIADLVLTAREAAPGLRLELSVAPFVPKPFTPFQWSSMLEVARLEKRAALLRTLLRKYGGMEIAVESPRWSAVQGIMARGDRRLAPVISSVAAEGDSISVWRRAMKQAGLNYDFYLYRSREETEIFPWDHLDIGLEKTHLRQSYNEAMKADA